MVMSGEIAKIKDKIPGYNSLVKPVHLVRALLAGLKYGFPARDLTVIGVTGTNGKTTTCFMIWKMLNEAGLETGLMTTAGWGYKKIAPELGHMTTVDSRTLNERILRIEEAGAKYLVLETTSHAMSQFRTLGVPIRIAVFTNLTHEHLDYHKTFENYRKAKMKLFKKAKFGVINADDESAKFFKQQVKKYITYGVKRGELRASGIRSGIFGTEYTLNEISARGDEGEKVKIKTQIPGIFNVYNSLAAVAVGRELGLKDEAIARGIAELESVEGRMNRIEEGQDFAVIVDYAHTPDALEQMFEAIGRPEGRIIAVHGGAGRRDESTREPRGEILGKRADIVIITEDDSRDEEREKIAQPFLEGAEKVGKKLGENLFLELDRGRAIKQALGLAKSGDLVLLLGKGHEKTILRGERIIPFEDAKVARKWLKKGLEEAKTKKEEKQAATKEVEQNKTGEKRAEAKSTVVADKSAGVASGPTKTTTQLAAQPAERDKDGRRIRRGLRLKRKFDGGAEETKRVING